MKNRFYSVVLLLLLFNLVSCEKKNSQTEYTNVGSKNDTLNVEKIIEKEDSCKVSLKSLIITSSLKNPFKDRLNVDIESKDKSKVTIRLFVETPDGENTENNIGWLVMDLQNKRLLDITADLENPIVLDYKIDFWNLVIDCYCKIKSDEEIVVSQQNLTQIDSTYSDSPEEIVYQNTSISKVYADLIANKDIEDVDELLVSFPKTSKNITLSQNKNGINSINYLIKDEISIITIYYDGGVNEIRLEKLKNNSVKRSIFHSAD